MNKYKINKNTETNTITLTRDHGECYGGERKTRIDTEGKIGKELYRHIEKYAGKAFAQAAKRQGFC